uniref:Zinc finger, CCHC-type n=1 Tax=Tanacetum cinerariifolium TaxID=118510 RepID=A0A6L2J7T5_TANCI|nr:zinc finger, CCHC-type [Tanacetum cinerariifolium]
MDDPEPEDKSINTPVISSFLDSEYDVDDEEVLSELEEYGNAGRFRHKKIINSFDGDDLTFQCMIGFRKFVAYFDPFLPMNIITRKVYNTIMVNGLESTRTNLVDVVRDVCVFVGSFTYVTDFVVLEDVDAIAWWIDSGATTHVCKDRCWFKTYEPVENEYVLYMGDDHYAPVQGKGSVALEFSYEKTITLFNVLYVPKLRKNLVFGLVLNKCGYKQVYESDKYILSKSGVFVGFGYYNNGMFMLNLNKVLDDSSSVYMSSSTVVNTSLWHARLGHVHNKRTHEMSKDDLIPSIDENLEKMYYLPKDIILNSNESQRDDHSDDVPSEIPEPRKGKRVRKAKLYGSNFQLYLVEGSRDQVGSQYSYCYSIEEDPITYNEAMQSCDVAFWKEAIDDEIDSIMENNTWVLFDLPPGCKPLGCKWIFKRKMKVDRTIDKFKAQLVIQGFRQKEGIDYFDTYAPVARITTIRLLLALAAIHNLVIHQMDVKTSFLNGDLEEKLPGNEHKVCKMVKSLYGLNQAPKQWHQKFDDVVLSSGFLLNQSNMCVYSKFDSSEISCNPDTNRVEILYTESELNTIQARYPGSSHTLLITKDILVFDIDETTLSNLPYNARDIVAFGTIPYNFNAFEAWVTEAKPQRGDNDGSGFKAIKRKDLEEVGYKISGDMGDQWSDLLGSNPGDRTFKVSDPMYYIG